MRERERVQCERVLRFVEWGGRRPWEAERSHFVALRRTGRTIANNLRRSTRQFIFPLFFGSSIGGLAPCMRYFTAAGLERLRTYSYVKVPTRERSIGARLMRPWWVFAARLVPSRLAYAFACSVCVCALCLRVRLCVGVFFSSCSSHTHRTWRPARARAQSERVDSCRPCMHGDLLHTC